MSEPRKIVLPVAVLLVGVLGTMLIVQARPDVERVEAEVPPPLVRVQPVELRQARLSVSSQGSVYAPTESDLVAEVSGAVVWVSASFEPGGFIARGEELLRLDPRDYELNVKSADAQLAQARLALAREEAEAEVAGAEWKELGGGEKASPLVLRLPQLAEARSRVQAAEAALARAELDLDRTRIRAPFAGRVRSERVDLGEFVARGAPLAVVYSVDFAEVRLPVPDAELAYLDLPLARSADGRASDGPEVELRAEFAGRVHGWQARIVRTEGEIDAATRMLHLVARVDDPYRGGAASERPPLAVGMFVTAEIEGRVVEGVAELPRAVLRSEDRVLVVDEENRLRFRAVEVLRTNRDTVMVSAGLTAADRIVVSALDVAVEGMVVRPSEAQP